MTRHHTTTAGHSRLLEALERARAAYRKVVDSNEEANESGDSSVWHDNFAYEENQRQMHQLSRRVRDMEHVLAEMNIVQIPTNPQEVVLGCAVVVEEDDSGEKRRYVIGGYEDGDLSVGRISYISPLAQTLLGAEKGDIRELIVGGQRRELEVLTIESAREGEV